MPEFFLQFASGKSNLEINISNPAIRSNSVVMDVVINMFKAELELFRDFQKLFILTQIYLDFIYMCSVPWHCPQSKS